MQQIESRLKELGIQLVELPKPLGSYLPCVQTGNLLFLSGILPFQNGAILHPGKVGETVTLQQAQEDARQVAVNMLSIVKAHVGDLDRIKRCVKVNGFVASASNFYDQPKVINGCSDLLVEVFGDNGRHARTAVGVSLLPLNASVEIDFVLEIDNKG
jgi:enamine deaminase RidA (YjgF/YER057c/UK114 family)